MALNPLREALAQAGLRAYQQESAFQQEADEALTQFQAVRTDLERQVRRGDITVKAAREKAADAAGRLKENLNQQAGGYSPVPRVFLDRLVEASNARKRSRDRLTSDGLQRETNRLLRLSLVEQQIQTRAAEFQGRASVRLTPGAQPAPTVDSVLAFHQTAFHAGDEAAMEWARRQLESMRGLVLDDGLQRQIDMACDRPDSVNPRLVAAYVQAMHGADPDAAEEFVDNALESRDANACVASFVMARDEPGGSAVRWVRKVLNGLGSFPDAALETLRSLEAEARGADEEAARAHAARASAFAETQARLDGLEAPTADELGRQDRARSRPVARLGEPIGLALDRRGAIDEDFPADQQTGADEV
jgi:hypothetical protein